jgi:hypothetical protein
MSPRFRYATLTVVLVAVAAALTGAITSSASSTRVQTLHIASSKPLPLTTLDFPPKGKSPGDVYVFSGILYAPGSRRVIGQVRGTQTSIKLEHGFETVQGMITYEFGSGNQIVVGGLGAYPLRGTGLVRGKKFVRPVLGGSGRYAGAHGEVISKQLPNHGYDQVFKLQY